MIMMMPSAGIPTLPKTEASITTPPPGMAGVPMEAATIVTMTTTILSKLISRP